METTLYTSREAAKAAILNPDNSAKRLITASFRAPARFAAVFIPSDAWNQMEAAISGDTSGNYKALLSAVLEKGAKSILAARIENMSVFPSTIDDLIFSPEAIMNEAIGGNSEWMSKEELTAAWEASKTRAKFLNDARYAGNAAYRKAVNTFADMVLKLAGKTTTYTTEECDALIAKFLPEDMDSELGSFVARRVEMIRNKPQKAEVDLSVL